MFGNSRQSNTIHVSKKVEEIQMKQIKNIDQ